MTDMVIRPETAEDKAAVYQVNAAAFEREDEARLVEALQADGYARISLVAEVEGQIVGHVLFSEMAIRTADGRVSSLALAPVAVVPEYQRQGIGSALIRAGLDAAREQGHRSVIVLGHTEYYPRFGFSPALARQLDSPFSGDWFMALELVPGALSGVRGKVEYPPPFGVE